MRLALSAVLAIGLVLPLHAQGLDPESKAPYQLRVVVRTADHPTLTKHFRAEIMKNVSSSLQAALGAIGTVEVIDLNSTPVESRDPLWKLVDEKGLEALDSVNTSATGKTHFISIDFVDGKYEFRTRQHDGTIGFSTPIIRKTVHGDRGFVGRLAGLAVAQDFGLVGTFDPNGPQVSLVLKAGELGPLDAWVKKGDVFAVVQVKQGRRTLPKVPKGKAKAEKVEPAAPAISGTRVDGVLLHVIDGPRNGLCVCKVYNRYKDWFPRDGLTLGYRAVRLGTGEGLLKLQLTDSSGVPHRSDSVQARVGVNDFPDANRDREEMKFSEGIFTSRETFKNIAFVVVKSGDLPLARIPVEIYPDRLAVLKVNLSPSAEPAPAMLAAADMLDRARSARVMQARAFEQIATIQEKERQKALEFGQAALDSLSKEGDALRADIARLRERYKADSPPGLFEPSDREVKALENKTRELLGHLAKLAEVIRLENDPMTAAARKKIEGLLVDAKGHEGNLDLDKAIANYEEALKLAMASEPASVESTQTALTGLKKLWEVKSPEHAAARKFIYATWVNLAQPLDVKNALPEARKAFLICKSAGDKFSVRKMYLTGPQVLEKYAEHLKKMLDDATDDEERKALAAYEKTTEELNKLLNDLGDK
ncbi:MAG: hypothetical protein EXS09_02170 [Gemmataceae bacterium]|nr:hypothetical protein [Gemmataceae bacterium]